MPILEIVEAIRCPAEAASALIEPAIRMIAEDGVLVVRVPLGATAAQSGLMLEHDVRFRVTHARDASGLNDTVVIAWEPDSPIPMPEFSGTVTADWNADGTGFILEIKGQYDPPGGVVGDAFDELVGSRIARATVHDLLSRVAHAIEAL